MLSRGDIWGTDMILDDWRLRDTQTVFSITFLQCWRLDKSKLLEVMESFPNVKPQIRQSAVRLALIRGIIRMARRQKRRCESRIGIGSESDNNHHSFHRQTESSGARLPPRAKLTHKRHRHTYSWVQRRTNVYGRVWAMFWIIFDRTDMKIGRYGVIFRVEFDGDARFFLAPPKSMFLSISIDFFDGFCKNRFFRFPCRRRAEIFAASAAAIL